MTNRVVWPIADGGCDPDAQNVNGETAIHAAASAGKTSVVVYLSRLNVDLNTVNK
jgi:ankyrin repeat protein